MNIANKVDELWLSSYLFSLFSRKLQDELQDSGYVVAFPCSNSVHRETFEKGIGLYDDRIIVAGEIKNFAEIKEKACSEIANYFYKTLDVSKEEMTEILCQYMQASTAVVDIDEGTNVILEFDFPLAIADLNRHIIDNKNSELIDRFKKVFSSNNSTMAREIKKGIAQLDENKIYKILNADNDKELKTSKYYACISADGDNFSKYLTSVTEKQKLEEFSAKCFDYGVKLSKRIKKYGGISIYQGGDDTLCLLPVENEDENIFDFVKDMYAIFDECFSNLKFIDKTKNEEKTVTLSAALGIYYYKFPLSEATSITHDKLDELKSGNKKGSLIVHCEKHSGQIYNFRIADMKDEKSYADLFKMFKKVKKSENEDENRKDDLVHSIKTNIFRFKELLEIALKADDPVCLDNLFENVYEDDNSERTLMFISTVKEYMRDSISKKTSIDEIIEQSIGVLGVSRFMEEERSSEKK